MRQDQSQRPVPKTAGRPMPNEGLKSLSIPLMIRCAHPRIPALAYEAEELQADMLFDFCRAFQEMIAAYLAEFEWEQVLF